MSRILVLLSSFCIAAAAFIGAVTSASAQKPADKPAEKTDKPEKSTKSEKTDQLDLDNLMSGIKSMIEKGLKEEEEEEDKRKAKSTTAPANK
jgi:hypothetical protein